ncbi:MAG: BON domain-containing protein [Desulfovibrio sp.]|nr:BON domain-containing protein [Desulfovibrio sp.]
MPTIAKVLPILMAFFLLNGCAYGILDDKRLLDTMSQDNALASNIKSALMKKDFARGFSVSVYSYYKHVFLVGELPPSFQERAVRIAQSKNPRSVTCHWFTPAKSADSDFILSSRLRTALIGAKNLSSTRVDTEVNAGRVVLLGVVGNEHERKIAIRTAHKVEGVINVTSYLMLPPHTHEPNTKPAKEVVYSPKNKP